MGNAWNFTEIAISPTGEELAVARGDTLAIFDGETLALETWLGAVTPMNIGRYYDLGWSSEGNLLAATFFDGNVRHRLDTDIGVEIWGFEEQSLLQLFSIRPFSLAWSAQGMLLAASDIVGNIWLMDVSRGMMILFDVHDLESIPLYSRLGWSPDNQYLAAADLNDYRLRLHSLDSTVPRIIESPDNIISTFSWSGDSSQIAIGNPTNSSVRLFDISTGELLRTLQGSTGRPFDVRWSPDGHTIARATSTGFFLWDVTRDDDQPSRSFVEDVPPFMRMAWSPDSQFLFSVDLDGSIYKWDIETGCVVAAALTDWSTISWLN